jgi:GT2 family glycosyltransferase/glycosyltransferase involved in cell wall biosynthesis
MPDSKTCVISVNYRGSTDTAACVRSLLASTVPVEVLIVDTTPNDSELQTALEFCCDVKLIRASANIGFGRGCNLGIEWALSHSSCEYLFLLNNDALVLPDSIQHLQDAMASMPDIGIVAPRIVFLDNPSALWYGGGEIDWRRASAFTPGYGLNARSPLAMTERYVTFASGCALFVRRFAAMKLGGFDPRFFMYEEDTEFCLRAAEEGFRIRYVPRSLILHRVQGSIRNGSSASSDFWSVDNARLPFYAFHVMRNRMLNVHLHARGCQWVTAMLCFPVMLIRRSIPFLIGGRIDAIMAMFRGTFDSWRVMSAEASRDETNQEISVAIIEPVGEHGGVHHYDFGLCRGLLSAGCRVSLYTGNETLNPAIPGLGFHTFYQRIFGQENRWLRGLRFVRCTFASIRYAVASRETICHFHLFNHLFTDLTMIATARLFKRKVVITVHDVDSLADSEARRSQLAGRVYRLADRVIAHNKISAEELKSVGLLPAKIAMIAHGHYLDSIQEMPSASTARRDLAIELSAKVVIFFGQIKHSKGLDILIKALPQVVREVPEVVLMIAGRPWKTDFTYYNALISQLNVRAHCRLLIRYIPDDKVTSLYAAADITVLPYRRIYQSGVLLMAMSCGCPAVVSDLPGMREIVTDGINGYVFENGSKDELARVLTRALRDEPGRRQVAARATEYIRHHHDWNQIGTKTLCVYREVLSRQTSHRA